MVEPALVMRPWWQRPADWLTRGLSDMMITTLDRVSPFVLVERERLRELLAEHRLSATGLVDPETTVEGGRLARAQLVLLGNYRVDGTNLVVQARVLRVTDQRVLAVATWEGPTDRLLKAPR